MGKNLNYFLAAVSASVIWGFFSIPLRMLKGYPSDEILMYRIFTALSISALICLIFRRKKVLADWYWLQAQPIEKKRKQWKLIVASTLFVTVNWFAFIYVINHVSVQVGAFAYMVCPILTALCGYLFLKEQLNKAQWAAIVISFISISLLAMGFYKDVAFSVFIAALYAVYLVLQKQIRDINKFHLLSLQLVLSSLIILPYYFLSGHAVPQEAAFWVLICIISGLFTVLPLFLNLYALNGLSSGTVGIIIYLNPITAFTVAFFYFGEVPNPLQIFSYLLLFMAVILFNRHLILKSKQA